MRETSRLQRLSVFLCLLSAPMIGLASEPFSYQTPMTEVASGSFYVEGRLGSDVQSEFLVDTGSGYVALTSDTFRKLQRESDVEFDRQISGRMANGKLVTVPVYRVAEFRLGDCMMRDVEVTVLSGSDRNILGLSALRKVEPFAMQLDPPTLYLSDCALDPEVVIAPSIR